MKCVVEQVTIEKYYNEHVKQMLDTYDSEVSDLTLVNAYLGKNKSNLDMIELDIDLVGAAAQFGAYLKYEVRDTRSVMCPHSPLLVARQLLM